MADSYLKGSICLSDIPKELIRRVTCKDGRVRSYLDVAVMQRREPKSFQRDWGVQTITHYISCAPPAAQRVEGQNYFIGDLETRAFKNASGEDNSSPMAQASSPGNDSDLPF